MRLPAFIVAAWLGTICASGHGAAAAQSTAEQPAADTLVSLQRGACEQRCAVYRLTIYADGTVTWDGRYFVRKTGLVRATLAPEAVARLVDDLQRDGFFELQGNYGYDGRANCDSIDGDGPSAILTVSSRGRSKTVLHNHRCVSVDARRLVAMEDRIDRAVGTVRWIR